ncbi:hypothetical protein ACE6H2_001639 [Prunus campanulata]
MVVIGEIMPMVFIPPYWKKGEKERSLFQRGRGRGRGEGRGGEEGQTTSPPRCGAEEVGELTKKARWSSVIEPQATSETRSDVLGFSHLARSLDLFSRTSSSLTVNMASMAASDD